MASEDSCNQSARLCENGCGLFGTPEKQGLCSKCYRDRANKIALPSGHVGDHDSASMKEAVKWADLRILDSVFVPAEKLPVPIATPTVKKVVGEKRSRDSGSEEDGGGAAAKGRCYHGQCKKKVGMIKGFKCRCGGTYCSAHRYPEDHQCSFDYKAAGREALVSANPLVKADKLGQRI